MRNSTTRRQSGSARDTAEAAFKTATTKPTPKPTTPKVPALPNAKELVSIRLDHDLLAHYQEEGPGWQERINAALRKAAGL
ncbi:BrnA antitoxin family protein [Ancylobacter sp. Lp-2]|uniref:BrnA antitoxin family protein n=1 Tax=Ancylobacter sp. Lp-2 TaxID=2881339 RepID=UPI001E43DA7E|nr:BrnA antitoxin family protein [Ancylobacter sp. Lp-2]MCB4770474.1 BrnA antitoxin family protein [Ancylobacter sp. Lp-2]